MIVLSLWPILNTAVFKKIIIIIYYIYISGRFGGVEMEAALKVYKRKKKRFMRFDD